jgi:hypothetical protein
MKGIVFTAFLDLVEQRHGIEVLDAIVEAAAPANGGAYTAVGTYDWRELAALVTALGDELSVPAASLLRGYGQSLFAVFVQRFPQFFVDVASPLDFLERVESYIHPEVQKLYPDAQLPRFDAARAPGRLELHYRSPRPLADFAQGLIEGCLTHFGAAATVGVTGAGCEARFVIQLREAPTCSTTPSR